MNTTSAKTVLFAEEGGGARGTPSLVSSSETGVDASPRPGKAPALPPPELPLAGGGLAGGFGLDGGAVPFSNAAARSYTVFTGIRNAKATRAKKKNQEAGGSEKLA